MTEDEMRRLASIIVDKIFERQAELDDEFLNEWQEQIIDQTALNNDQDEIQRLETVELTIAEDPLARQFNVENALEKVKTMAGRSTAGRPGQRGGVKRKKR